MFLDTEKRPQGEPAKVGTLKLSEAIRKGLPIVGQEGRYSFQTCAMGCAFAGVMGRSMTDKEETSFVGGELISHGVAKRIAEFLGFPARAGSLANGMHLHQLMGAIEIADRLEKQGY